MILDHNAIFYKFLVNIPLEISFRQNPE